MEYRRLFILIEGDDDERFFDQIIKPRFEKTYDLVKLWKYARAPKKRVKNLLSSVKAMNADYIFVTDINLSPCISEHKQKTKKKYTRLELDRIMVVVHEIESWFLAGLGDKNVKKFRISSSQNTDKVTKHQFDRLIPKKYASRVDFMQEILKVFDIEIGKQKNESFKYFLEKNNL